MKKTKAEQRVEIANDVLKHIKTGKIIAQHGDFWQPETPWEFCNKPLKETLQKVKECKVCAIGSVFYSYVMRHNKYVIDSDGIYCISETDILNTATMFSENQLRLIEAAFEKKDFSFGVLSLSKSDTAIAYKLKNGLQKDEETLIHIMKNIIRNKGTFKP